MTDLEYTFILNTILDKAESTDDIEEVRNYLREIMTASGLTIKQTTVKKKEARPEKPNL